MGKVGRGFADFAVGFAKTFSTNMLQEMERKRSVIQKLELIGIQNAMESGAEWDDLPAGNQGAFASIFGKKGAQAGYESLRINQAANQLQYATDATTGQTNLLVPQPPIKAPGLFSSSPSGAPQTGALDPKTATRVRPKAQPPAVVPLESFRAGLPAGTSMAVPGKAKGSRMTITGAGLVEKDRQMMQLVQQRFAESAGAKRFMDIVNEVQAETGTSLAPAATKALTEQISSELFGKLVPMIEEQNPGISPLDARAQAFQQVQNYIPPGMMAPELSKSFPKLGTEEEMALAAQGHTVESAGQQGVIYGIQAADKRKFSRSMQLAEAKENLKLQRLPQELAMRKASMLDGRSQVEAMRLSSYEQRGIIRDRAGLTRLQQVQEARFANAYESFQAEATAGVEKQIKAKLAPEILARTQKLANLTKQIEKKQADEDFRALTKNIDNPEKVAELKAQSREANQGYLASMQNQFEKEITGLELKYIEDAKPDLKKREAAFTKRQAEIAEAQSIDYLETKAYGKAKPPSPNAPPKGLITALGALTKKQQGVMNMDEPDERIAKVKVEGYNKLVDVFNRQFPGSFLPHMIAEKGDDGWIGMPQDGLVNPTPSQDFDSTPTSAVPLWEAAE